MKITAKTKELARTLAEVAPFAPAKAVINILKYAKVTTKGNRIKIEANDQSSGIVKYMEVMECDQDGTFLIDIAEFSKYISKINSDTVEITAEDDSVSVRHSKGTAEFVTAEAQNYPSFVMKDEECVEVTLPSNLLANVIDKGKGFVGTDVARPIMTAILAYVSEGKFGFCATDTGKLVYGEIDTDIDTEIKWMIMPGAFGALSKSLAECEDVTVRTNEKHTLYKLGNTQILTAQVAGNFPNFKRVIPENHDLECTVEKNDVLDALKRLTLITDNLNCVKAEITPMDMNLSVDNVNMAKKAVENLPHGGCNGNITIGISSINLAACVGLFREGEIEMLMTDTSRPIVFKHKSNPNLTALSMPMQLVG